LLEVFISCADLNFLIKKIAGVNYNLINMKLLVASCTVVGKRVFREKGPFHPGPCPRSALHYVPLESRLLMISPFHSSIWTSNANGKTKSNPVNTNTNRSFTLAGREKAKERRKNTPFSLFTRKSKLSLNPHSNGAGTDGENTVDLPFQ